jgi:hypothetical protein
MNAAQATLYGALIGALIAGIFTLLGVVAGLLDQAWLRRRGEETVPHLGVKGHLETQEVNHLGFCHLGDGYVWRRPWPGWYRTG